MDPGANADAAGSTQGKDNGQDPGVQVETRAHQMQPQGSSLFRRQPESVVDTKSSCPASSERIVGENLAPALDAKLIQAKKCILRLNALMDVGCIKSNSADPLIEDLTQIFIHLDTAESRQQLDLDQIKFTQFCQKELGKFQRARMAPVAMSTLVPPSNLPTFPEKMPQFLQLSQNGENYLSWKTYYNLITVDIHGEYSEKSIFNALRFQIMPQLPVNLQNCISALSTPKEIIAVLDSHYGRSSLIVQRLHDRIRKLANIQNADWNKVIAFIHNLQDIRGQARLLDQMFRNQWHGQLSDDVFSYQNFSLVKKKLCSPIIIKLLKKNCINETYEGKPSWVFWEDLFHIIDKQQFFIRNQVMAASSKQHDYDQIEFTHYCQNKPGKFPKSRKAQATTTKSPVAIGTSTTATPTSPVTALTSPLSWTIEPTIDENLPQFILLSPIGERYLIFKRHYNSIIEKNPRYYSDSNILDALRSQLIPHLPLDIQNNIYYLSTHKEIIERLDNYYGESSVIIQQLHDRIRKLANIQNANCDKVMDFIYDLKGIRNYASLLDEMFRNLWRGQLSDDVFNFPNFCLVKKKLCMPIIELLDEKNVDFDETCEGKPSKAFWEDLFHILDNGRSFIEYFE